MTEYIRIADNCVIKIEYSGDSSSSPVRVLTVIRDGSENEPRKQVRSFICALVDARKTKKDGYLSLERAKAAIWAYDYNRDIDLSESFKKVLRDTRACIGGEAFESRKGNAFRLVNEIVVSGGEESASVPDAMTGLQAKNLPSPVIYRLEPDWDSRKIFVISAPPGYGKTTAALQYAKKMKKSGFIGKAVLIDCLSLGSIYRSLGLSVIGNGEDYGVDRAFERLRGCIASEAEIQQVADSGVLLILDNYRCEGETADRAAGDLAERAARAFTAENPNVFAMVCTWLDPSLSGFSEDEAHFEVLRGMDAGSSSSVKAALDILSRSEEGYAFTKDDARQILSLAGNSSVSPAELSAVRISVNMNYAGAEDKSLGWKNYYAPKTSPFEEGVYSLGGAVSALLSQRGRGGALFSDMLKLAAVMGLDSFEPEFMLLCLKRLERSRELDRASMDAVFDAYSKKTGVFEVLGGGRVRLLHCYRSPVLSAMSGTELYEAFGAVAEALRLELDCGIYYSMNELEKVSRLSKYVDGLVSAAPENAGLIADILCHTAWYYAFCERNPMAAGEYYEIIERAVPGDSDTVFIKALAKCDRMFLRLKSGELTADEASETFFAVNAAAEGLEDHRQMLLARLHLVAMEYLIPRIGSAARLGGMSADDISEAASALYPGYCAEAASRLGKTPVLRGEYAFVMEHAAALAVCRARAASLENIGGSRDRVIRICSPFINASGSGLSPEYEAGIRRLGSLASLFGQKPFRPENEALLFARLRNSLGVAFFEGDNSPKDLLRSLLCFKDALDGFDSDSFEYFNTEMNVQTVFRLLGSEADRRPPFDPGLAEALEDLTFVFTERVRERYGLADMGFAPVEAKKREAARYFNLSASILSGLALRARVWKREGRSGFSDLITDIDQNTALLALAALSCFDGEAGSSAASELLEKGIAGAERACADAGEKGQSYRERTFLRYAAALYVKKGEPQKALDLIERSLSMTEKNDASLYCLALEVKGRAVEALGDEKLAERFLASLPREVILDAPESVRIRMDSLVRDLEKKRGKRR